MAYPLRPHFRFPFERGSDGKVMVTEQHTSDHINSQITAVISTPQGFRPERPDFGWPFPEFVTAPVNTAALGAAIHKFVPDATFTIHEWADEVSAAVRHIRIEEEI